MSSFPGEQRAEIVQERIAHIAADILSDHAKFTENDGDVHAQVTLATEATGPITITYTDKTNREHPMDGLGTTAGRWLSVRWGDQSRLIAFSPGLVVEDEGRPLADDAVDILSLDESVSLWGSLQTIRELGKDAVLGNFYDSFKR